MDEFPNLQEEGNNNAIMLMDVDLFLQQNEHLDFLELQNVEVQNIFENQHPINHALEFNVLQVEEPIVELQFYSPLFIIVDEPSQGFENQINIDQPLQPIQLPAQNDEELGFLDGIIQFQEEIVNQGFEEDFLVLDFPELADIPLDTSVDSGIFEDFNEDETEHHLEEIEVPPFQAEEPDY